ncbi:phosphate ABC transporter permease subunit PstC [Sinimarinibacterium sp. NLF-5-8]|uniref:phosphate ABC transporter permease subunit PstC n=1 Tax=Sinimarinibacterium sp. NLF-5-8 TaxID=2698684 RepID=UPI00137BD9DA|nr:phosphate ABC transporter permease subunit PstC [Sinimarinibacterium sp. NLF-5-8]QHS11237.1 phosphate ABC transporter permease subunit PstC [Sinimarinibacterium sp. NLF-5-8]
MSVDEPFSNTMVIAALLGAVALAYQLGLRRSRALVTPGATARGTALHSRPSYYGAWTALWAALPALAVLAVWSIAEPQLLRSAVLAELPATATMTVPQQDAVLRRVQAIASGKIDPASAAAEESAAALRGQRLHAQAQLGKLGVTMLFAIGGLLYARRRIRADLRARNQVERVIRIGLVLCSGIAILTTLGIVLSMLSEALRFFSFVSPLDFFFGTRWEPRFSSVGTGEVGHFGLLPLLAGTLMVSAIALMVAVPMGLMTAIYLAEYAPAKLRAFAKPVIEVLAGIPTIVYGVLALMTVGPFLSALGAWLGVDVRATSALTAGLVMGVMIIPFVSSLSDDIITQVPRGLRDGALGLGATRSETIRNVVLPAALPGIVGAFLLAGSRAIGETMIVVLAAGNSPLLHGNPFEAVSTVTVSIVNQLTGDTDFASPQSLVAFALGLTLFVITLALNVVALHIVRKYREQYE